MISGCDDGRLKTYPVSGVVEFEDGTSVHVGTIELKSREHAINARGQIEADGSFTLSTYDTGDGAVAGKHDCVVIQMVMGEDLSFQPGSEGVVPPRYGSYSTSDLVVEVDAQGDNDLKITLSPLPPGRFNGRDHEHKHDHIHDHSH